MNSPKTTLKTRTLQTPESKNDAITLSTGSFLRPETHAKSRRRLWLSFSHLLEAVTALSGSLSALISLGTLLGLVYTIRIAEKQWSAMNEATRQATRAADEAHDQVEQAKRALLQSKRQFVDDQRPYLWLDESDASPKGYVQVEPYGSGVNTGKLAAEIWLKNFGKSPAINVHSYAYISTGTKNLENDVHWERLEADLHRGVGSIYAPGGTFFKTARSVDIVDPNLLRRSAVPVPTQSAPIGAIHLRIVYFDQSGHKYITEVCRLLQANPVGTACRNHNLLQ